MVDWWLSTLISAVVAALVLCLIFANKTWPGAKVVLCMIPFARTATFYIVTADAVQKKTSERIKKWLLGQIAFSGLCQNWSVWLMYLDPPYPFGLLYPTQNPELRYCSKDFVFQNLVPYCIFIVLNASTYWFIKKVPYGLYIAAGMGTAANLYFFFVVVFRRVRESKNLLQSHEHSEEKVCVQGITVFFVTIAYLFSVSAALQESGPLLSNAVAAVPYTSFIVVPLSGARLQTQRRKMLGMLWGIAFNNNFLSWILYALSYTAVNWWQPAVTLVIGVALSLCVVPSFATDDYKTTIKKMFTLSSRTNHNPVELNAAFAPLKL